MLANVAELGARMEETIGKASLRNAAIGTGDRRPPRRDRVLPPKEPPKRPEPGSPAD